MVRPFQKTRVGKAVQVMERLPESALNSFVGCRSQEVRGNPCDLPATGQSLELQDPVRDLPDAGPRREILISSVRKALLPRPPSESQKASERELVHSRQRVRSCIVPGIWYNAGMRGVFCRHH